MQWHQAAAPSHYDFIRYPLAPRRNAILWMPYGDKIQKRKEKTLMLRPLTPHASNKIAGLISLSFVAPLSERAPFRGKLLIEFEWGSGGDGYIVGQCWKVCILCWLTKKGVAIALLTPHSLVCTLGKVLRPEFTAVETVKTTFARSGRNCQGFQV